eukprot:TRINITY_DN24824_c0_g1_i1.p2 TRINITY_DN24824_c0_g1~~TRINITY_DN24824_c0_g1_i1.p2  ORF type:complete len:134 (+),score=26.27 TRINITY_DN24824_c0_g1_i1:93-494(+)
MNVQLVGEEVTSETALLSMAGALAGVFALVFFMRWVARRAARADLPPAAPQGEQPEGDEERTPRAEAARGAHAIDVMNDSPISCALRRMSWGLLDAAMPHEVSDPAPRPSRITTTAGGRVRSYHAVGPKVRTR